ncbi:hypothetical protein D3C87_1986420 [compost metagenome]
MIPLGQRRDELVHDAALDAHEDVLRALAQEGDLAPAEAQPEAVVEQGARGDLHGRT